MIDIQVIRKDIKNAYIRVNPNDGRVIMTVPKGMSQEEVNSLIEEKSAWIESHKQRFEDMAATGYDVGSRHMFWGERYTLAIGDYGIDEDEKVIYVNEPTEESVNELRRKLLAEKLDVLVPEWEEKTDIYVDEWKIRDMSTRWGSCNILKARIWISLMLTKYPQCCLEETICHELMHMKVRGHGPVFKSMMDVYCPDWREIKKMMK